MIGIEDGETFWVCERYFEDNNSQVLWSFVSTDNDDVTRHSEILFLSNKSLFYQSYNNLIGMCHTHM